MPVPTEPVTEPAFDLRLLLAVQRVCSGPPLVAASRALGAAGEHALVWVGVGAAGAVLDRSRRADWVSATAAVVVAHALSVGIKRLTRRARPEHADLVVHRGAGGHWGFPSSHAASTTAAAIVYGRLLGTPSTAVLPPVMGLSRLVVGAHYASDVLAGCAVGAATAYAHGRRRRWRVDP